MTHEAYVKYVDTTFNELKALLAKKNADYSSAQDAFANNRAVEAFGVSTTEANLFGKLLDKMSRIATFIREGTYKVKEESVADSLDDLIGYAVLMKAYLSEKSTEQSEKESFKKLKESVDALNLKVITKNVKSEEW